MPRSSQQNQQLKDARREQIMQAGLHIFAHKGLAATKISDIAAAADLSYGLVYHYFHDKEELYFALVERALQGTVNLTAQALARSGPAWERLRLLCTEMLAGARTTPEYFQIILQARVNEQPLSAIHTLLTRYSNQVWDNLTAIIRQAQAEGQVVEVNAHELAVTLTAVIQGLSLNQTFDFQARDTFPDVATVLRFLRPTIPLEEDPRHAN
jgi:AcrR family transcriptional regulator